MGGQNRRFEDRTDHSEVLLGQVVLDRFRIEIFLSSGTTGRVFRGVEAGTGRPVAVKVLRSQDPNARQRFRREVKFLKAVRHRNVVELIDDGVTTDGDPVMVMELLSGRSVQALLQDSGPMAAVRVVEIGAQVADALQVLHNLGGVHRDLKPANVVLERDETGRDLAKVLDFGLVKPFGRIAETMAHLTMFDRVLGTPLYMAPEQVSDQSIDGQTDIYALGIMMFEMIAGQTPFELESVPDIMYGHLTDPVPALREIRPSVQCPASIEALIRRCLAKKPADRPPTMTALAALLRDQVGAA